MSVDIRKKNIPSKIVNPTLVEQYVSIWDIVQLLKFGAVQLDKLPKDIQDKVNAELDRRHKVYEAKIKENKPISA